MMFARGNKFGGDILIVDEFPVSPISNVIYLNSTTMEQKCGPTGDGIRFRKSLYA